MFFSFLFYNIIYVRYIDPCEGLMRIHFYGLPVSGVARRHFREERSFRGMGYVCITHDIEVIQTYFQLNFKIFGWGLKPNPPLVIMPLLPASPEL